MCLETFGFSKQINFQIIAQGSFCPRRTEAHIFIMGRDPVELAKRAKYKPPAMRVRGVCYTKKSPFRYNFGCSSLNYNEGKGDFNGQ